MTKIFFATDVHGSERCWKKLVAAGKFYGVDKVILGGDMTGKAVLPLVDYGDGSYKTEFMGKEWNLSNNDEIEELEKHIRTNGFYPYKLGSSEFKEMQESKELQEKVFNKLVIETLEYWLKFADEKLEGTDLYIYVAPGNDDDFIIDPLFNKSKRVLDVEGKVIKIDEDHEMLSSGFSNPTPWKTPRECTEEELKSKIEKMIPEVENMSYSIFNLHAPPYGTGLDEAPSLDESLKPTEAGMSRTSVGSKTVLNTIEKYQPLLGLHGHIHESKGARKLGRTLCINPGSEYADGTLLGYIVEMDRDKIKSYFPTSG